MATYISYLTARMPAKKQRFF